MLQDKALYVRIWTLADGFVCVLPPALVQGWQFFDKPAAPFKRRERTVWKPRFM
jgi:hypothetical protein